MKEKPFVDHLRALRNGTDDYTVPDEPYFSAPDQPIVGRYIRVSDGQWIIRA